jgi:serine/threonine-protein kinase HipA
MGGAARPKALLDINGEEWVIKFSDGDPADTPLIEHATMTLAHEAGIRVAVTRPVRLTHGHAVAVKRFDRQHRWLRQHCLSASVALRAASDRFGYPELAQLLRRQADASTSAAQMRELFRRMVFNILIDNTDDHEKNHALQHVTEVARVVDGWREHFTQCGVTARDIDLYAQQIDRPFLLDQRRQAAAPLGH